MTIFIRWNGRWYPGQIVREVTSTSWEISYDGYGDDWNEVVGADRLRLAVAPHPRVALLARCDERRVVFGAATHGYAFAPPYMRNELVDEVLTADYVAFVTTYGRSGAGPYYGLCEPEPVDGGVKIAEHGCGSYSYLVASGEVWADVGGTRYREARSFTEWYEHWLDEALVEWAELALPELAMCRGEVEHEGVAAVRPLLHEPRAIGYLRLYERRYDDALAAFDRARDRERFEPEARHALDHARVFHVMRDARRVVAACDRGLAVRDIWFRTRDQLRELYEIGLVVVGRRADALAVLADRAEANERCDLYQKLAYERMVDRDYVGAARALQRAAERGVGLAADKRATASADERLARVVDPLLAKVPADDARSVRRALTASAA
jgi:hypothetical protein